MACMNNNYRETISDLVVMATPDGSRAAAEFTVAGEYLQHGPGQPVALGQKYELLAGAFFAIRDNKIARVTNYYNLEDWITQISQ